MASSCLWWLPIKTFLKSIQCFVFQENLQITVWWIEKTHWWNTLGKDRFCSNGIWSYSTKCGPDHIEKKPSHCNYYSVVGFEKIASICNFKSKAQQDLFKKVKDHHKVADFLLICLQTLAKGICFQFWKEWSKHNSHIPNYQDLEKYFSLGTKWNKLGWASPGQDS